MSRSNECLIDAGCLLDYSSGQPVDVGMRQETIGFARTIRLWHERLRQRRELRELAANPDLLRDVGLSNYQVQQEARKPFWRD